MHRQYAHAPTKSRKTLTVEINFWYAIYVGSLFIQTDGEVVMPKVILNDKVSVRTVMGDPLDGQGRDEKGNYDPCQPARQPVWPQPENRLVVVEALRIVV